MTSLLHLQNISKRYPGVLALDNVSFSLNVGEVHCLVGENGAGKSTLVKILAGAIAPDAGSIRVNGESMDDHTPLAALQKGIGIIFQDFKLVPALTVAENIHLGHEPRRQGFIDRRAMNAAARDVLAQLGEDIDPAAQVATLSISQRQMVEIAKAMSRNVRILAMDEPTASLTEPEIVRMFKVIRRLVSEGVGVIYISHRLEEIFEIGNRVTVLRDGRHVVTSPVEEVDRTSLIRLMVGRELEQEYPKVALERGDEVLCIEHLRSERVRDVSLTLYRGEILGLAGLVGAGRTELVRLVFGADQKTGGRIILDGEEINPQSPHDAITEGIGLLTEDRNRYGLVLSMSVKENITLAGLEALKGRFFVRDGEEQSLAERQVHDLRIKPPDANAGVATLSGGNRQKVVLARWLSTQARVLMFDEPTAGIDVGARFEIYTMMNRLASAGLGVLVVSSDLPELLGICDRIAVLCEGRLTGVLSRAEATQERIMTLATQRTGTVAHA